MEVKCGRCNTRVLTEKGGWTKCPKCGHTQFSSLQRSVEIPAKKGQPLPSPIEKGDKKVKS